MKVVIFPWDGVEGHQVQVLPLASICSLRIWEIGCGLFSLVSFLLMFCMAVVSMGLEEAGGVFNENQYPVGFIEGVFNFI